jgi:hypothetical protein
MIENSFHDDNHYVPNVYLKTWSSANKRVWTYRILVSHENVPLWKPNSIKGIAYRAHLYTSLVAGKESDEIEKWLDREFEAPAAEALQKITSDAQLTDRDWKRLALFLAAQDVRTPARLQENLRRWTTMLPGLIENTLKESVKKLEVARASGQPVSVPKATHTNYIPFRLTTEIESGKTTGKLKGETIAGRGLWLFGIRHLLTKTSHVLAKHRWTILTPPSGIRWFTSDDPVIRLNFQSYDKYDFKGGWGSSGTKILLPLSPRHLLYTQVGHRPPRRGTELPHEKAMMICRFIAEHAHRMIFAAEQDNLIPLLRPRTVSAQLFKDEEKQWQKWHEEQTEAERVLMGWKENQD